MMVKQRLLNASVASLQQRAKEAAARLENKAALLESKDFYAIDLAESSFKDDVASMEAPLYSLSKVKDKEIWTWESFDGKKD